MTMLVLELTDLLPYLLLFNVHSLIVALKTLDQSKILIFFINYLRANRFIMTVYK